jgi:hypothetical protein
MQTIRIDTKRTEMEIYVMAKTVKETLKALGDKAEELGYNTWMYANKKPSEKVNISLDELELDGLIILQGVMKENEEDDVRKVSKLVNALKNTENRSVDKLDDFPKFFKEFLKTNGNPLLHSLDAELRGVAYLPIECTFVPARRYDSRSESQPYVTITFAYNTKMQYRQFGITLHKTDMHASVPAILRRSNLMVPDETMTEDYAKVLTRYEEYGRMQAEQFWVKGQANTIGGENWWANRNQLNLTYRNKPTKAVLDIDASTDGHSHISARALQYSEVYEDKRSVPTHPVLPVFSMIHHTVVWVNVINMKKYKYEEGLRDKLVLPKSHVRLIGALVSNLDALRSENESEDKSRTIRAKASSSIILAKGPAGTGKTLTAEVYAEEIKRPLYEVQSGQIGTSPEEIEENLQIILNRSVRLRMPLLINEADVFIQKRGRELNQNAVVSVFLRLLEYHNGLVFLTTNRADDVDDAILSRCIAEIQYGIPGPAERLKLWEIMLAEFNVTLPKVDVRKAVLSFPEMVGRDIQNLIRLTNRVCAATEEAFSLQLLRENAVFKGIKVLSDKELAAEIARREATQLEKVA